MQISDAESRVMAILWSRGPSTAEEVFDEIGDAADWQEATVKTLLNRLLKKGAVAATAEGRRYRYRPLLEQSQWVLDTSRNLVDRLFGGRVAPLVAHFSEHGALSRADIEALRRLIQDIDGGR
ncbi:MAG: BlaI/MecI/CopY family transcriptional regulator [Xanthomonadaceae bacterium]|jgi:predicted transcriptional regulator|nr:BlaI/MecI/CopY family transcriptional regulator [Xanthomonadaceae bacterium]